MPFAGNMMKQKFIMMENGIMFEPTDTAVLDDYIKCWLLKENRIGNNNSSLCLRGE